jgi:hypothetical protein
VPPPDPEEWTDEQWLEWLKATDAEVEAEGRVRPASVAGRLARSTGAQLLGQAMMGMAHAIYGQKDDEVVIVAEGNSEPEKDELFTLHLDPNQPERSSVVFRSVSEPPA